MCIIFGFSLNTSLLIGMECQICNKKCDGVRGLGNHVVKNHNVKEYYDKFLKKENEGQCKICGNKTNFYRLSVGYRTTCSQTCSRKLMNMSEARQKSKETILMKYGVENPSQIEGIREIISQKAKLRLSDENERKRISELTKKAMWKPDIREKYLMNKKPMSEKSKEKLSKLMKQRHSNIEFRNKLYTEERNQKISDSKKEYWKNNPEQKQRVSEIWKVWKERDEEGWRKHVLEAGKKGFGKGYPFNKPTSLEIKINDILTKENIKFIKQYELENKFYDFYIPDKNVLIEADGDFWHKQNLEECKYDFQIEGYYNDLLKNQIAEKNGYKLIRIRENCIPNTISELL